MSYDARPREILENLAKSGFDDDAAKKIRATLEGYFRQREARLENLLELLEPGRKGPCHKVWLEKGREAMNMVLDTFKRAEAGKLWLARIANEEHRFFYHLYVSQVPVQRDRMVRHSEALRKAMKELDNKWQVIKSKDGEVDAKLKKVADEYEKLLVKAAHEAAKTEKESKEKMADLVKTVLKVGLKLVDWGIVEKALSGGAAALGKALDETKSRKLEIFALLSREEHVIGAFKEAREMVSEFLEENGYPILKDAWDDGDRAAGELAAKMPTAGQKSDAAVFAKGAEDELKKVFSVAEKEYKEFARKHEHLFFGPLGSGYFQEIAEGDSWKATSERWKDKREDFDDILRERVLLAGHDRILEVSLEGLDDLDRKAIYNRLKDDCEKVLRAWNWYKEETEDDPYEILTSREKMQKELLSLR